MSSVSSRQRTRRRRAAPWFLRRNASHSPRNSSTDLQHNTTPRVRCRILIDHAVNMLLSLFDEIVGSPESLGPSSSGWESDSSSSGSAGSIGGDDIINESCVFGSMMVNPSSRTPYTDATRAVRGKGDAGIRCGGGKKRDVSSGHIKRPMNAFMVWSQVSFFKVVLIMR